MSSQSQLILTDKTIKEFKLNEEKDKYVQLSLHVPSLMDWEEREETKN
jgi:hypothetical protein